MFASLMVLSRVSAVYESLYQWLEPRFAELDVSMAGFELLSAVQAAGDGATQNALAARLGITPPSLSESIRGAVAKGWIEQAPSETDRRAKRIALTPFGKRLLEGCVAAMKDAETRALRGLPNSDLQLIAATLQKMAANLAE
ncbi:MAG: winged helix-turn-helix transcriptional regulator [Fimbriimonadaceae bacterium]|nr:winged helix-turn-helix transcriptional regulator [Fimbriimonadaceae bacterium]